MTFRLAILSDVHGDLKALEDALASIETLGCDAIVCAGDLVDYGIFPEETITLLASRGIPTILGNHDRWALTRGREAGSLGGGLDLSEASVAFLEALPTSWSIVVEGVRVAVHHASPKSDMDGLLPDEIDAARARRCVEKADADVLIVGHTHVAFALGVGASGLIANPGGAPPRSCSFEREPCVAGHVRDPELAGQDVHRAPREGRRELRGVDPGVGLI